MNIKDELKKIVIENGEIRAVYVDDIMKYMDRKNTTIDRASHVDYNNDLKKWEVRGSVTNKVYGYFDTREDALSFEVNLLLQNDIKPL